LDRLTFSGSWTELAARLVSGPAGGLAAAARGPGEVERTGVGAAAHHVVVEAPALTHVYK